MAHDRRSGESLGHRGSPADLQSLGKHREDAGLAPNPVSKRTAPLGPVIGPGAGNHDQSPEDGHADCDAHAISRLLHSGY